ncbi:small oligopeptide transporter, partial [Flagelloscypha sp. PMI_526]
VSSTTHDNYIPFDPNLGYDSVSEILDEDSPYPEVRSAVANFDDPDMPASTIRTWVIGLFFAVLFSAMNQFFFFRYPSVAVGNLVAQLVVFPVGRLWARFMPTFLIFGHSWNPGPFTIKEHVLVTIMATVGAVSAYATDIIAVQAVYYNQHWSFGYQWMLVVSTQLIGFSVGGIAKRFLVNPPSMIWPNTLVSCALFNTLHSQSYVGIGEREGMGRERFFYLGFLAAFLWYFIPGYLFQALSMFTWACWIAPNNKTVNQLFGYQSGLGFSILTFDWTQIAYLGSPLATPWWAEANVIIGFIFFMWFLCPILLHFNVWNSQHLPVAALRAYDNTAEIYDVTRIISPDATLDVEKYNAYSPIFLPLTFILSYGLEFLSISAAVTHSIIHFWKPIKLQFGKSLREQADIHARLMTVYRIVPEWHYGCIFVVSVVLASLAIRLWPTGLEIWGLILALVISFVYVIPLGMIQAVTNRPIGLNVFAELVIGYVSPGKPVAMMIFKTFGYTTMTQALQFTQDFKLGHYMKVPPRPMFYCQVIATVVAATTQLGIQAWMFSSIEDICVEHQKDKFICASTHVFGTASVIWGVIGPARFLGQTILLFLFLIGASCPVLMWLICKRFPNTKFNYIRVLFGALADLPPATPINFVPWGIVGFMFQYVVRRRHFSFWAKYNYVLSAALDAGTAVCVIVIYFALQYPRNGAIGENSIQQWWGNRVFRDTLDWNYTAIDTLSPGQLLGGGGIPSGIAKTVAGP